MSPVIDIGGRKVGGDHPCYVIAEISCNHEGDFEEARRIIQAAADAGANAVKIQSYTPETITRSFAEMPKGTIWEHMNLHGLYKKAYTPWEWARGLKKAANDLGLHFFSSPFDETAVDFLVQEIGVPVLKIASFEAVDIKLLEKAAKTGLPVILSNGMTDFLEMDEAVRTLRAHSCKDLALLHCNSGYPAAFEEANLKTIRALAALYKDAVVGLSNHTLFADPENYARPLAHVTPLEAVHFGAKIIEVHLMLDRARARELFSKKEGGFDWPFSLEPEELKKTIAMIRAYEQSGRIEYETEEERRAALTTHGQVSFEPTAKEQASRALRPSLWVVEDVKAGEMLKFAGGKPGNIDSIRPAGGLHIRFADLIDGKAASCDLKAGTPLAWDMVRMD